MTKTISYLSFISFLMTSSFAVSAQQLQHIGNENTLAELKTELLRLSERAGGEMGISLYHLETGVHLDIKGDDRFLMASTYKIPVAVTLLLQVDAGIRKLSDMVEVGVDDMVMAYGTTEHIQNPGVILSLRNMLDPMLIASDNTSTDVLMEQVGGPNHITKEMQALGIEGMTVSRKTATLIRDYFKLTKPLKGEKQSLLKQLESYTADEIAAMSAVNDTEFANDEKDTATPNAMATLLRKVWDGEILSEANTKLIKTIMLRCETGKERLKGLLPANTQVAHKTGTIGGTSNDAGIIYLPNEKGHLITVVYIKNSDKSYAQRDRAIAEVARAAHDYFAFAIK